MSEKYNGWTNYETWCVNLWMTNSEHDQNAMSEMAQEAWGYAAANANFTREECAAFDLAGTLQQFMDDRAAGWMPDQASLFADLINASLGCVDWHEIAAALIEDVEK